MPRIPEPNDSDPNLNRVTVTLQFNKTSKVYTGMIQFTNSEQQKWLNYKDFEYRDVDLDVAKETVVGNLDNFKIVPKNSLPHNVFESTIDRTAGSKIESVFPIHQQVNILSDILYNLIEKQPDLVDPRLQCEFLEMRKRIQHFRDENRMRKRALMSDPKINYVTVEQELEHLRLSQMEAGERQFNRR